jgi:hypothetical protein
MMHLRIAFVTGPEWQEGYKYMNHGPKGKVGFVGFADGKMVVVETVRDVCDCVCLCAAAGFHVGLHTHTHTQGTHRAHTARSRRRAPATPTRLW